ncbi:MAG: NUDIX hydrolase, partial [Halohasta sp.]
METTRHFTSTVYIVHEGATALHHHDRLGIRVPPGGHVDRD